MVIEPGGLECQQFGRLQLGPDVRQGMGDGLERIDYPLWVQAVEQVIEAAPNFADDVFIGDFKAIDEHLVRVDRRAAELVDLTHSAPGSIEVGEEQGQPL